MLLKFFETGLFQMPVRLVRGEQVCVQPLLTTLPSPRTKSLSASRRLTEATARRCRHLGTFCCFVCSDLDYFQDTKHNLQGNLDVCVLQGKIIVVMN